MIQTTKIITMAIAIATVAFTACSKNTNPPVAPDQLSNKVVLQWSEVAYNAFGGAQYQHSLMASRINAMTHLAMHDALNGIDQKYGRYAFTGTDAKADPIAAAASAAHALLLNELPERKGFLDSTLAQSLAEVEDGDAKSRGISLGKEAAQAVITKRSNDGAAGDPVASVPVSDVPGVYQAVQPFTFMFAPFWEKVKLFSLERKDQFRSKPLPALNSAEYATAFNEVKQTGKLNSSTTRTADETAYAKFWYEFSEAGWNRVARTVVANKNLGLYEAARLFALVDMALADAYTAGWDSKIHYNFWRPSTLR